MKLSIAPKFRKSASSGPSAETGEATRSGRPRLRKLFVAGLAVTALVGTAAVAQASQSHHAPQAVKLAATSWTTDPTTTTDGDWSYGTWEGHRIVLPKALAPRGARLTSILAGRGVLVYTCTNGVFANAEPQINLFTLKGAPTGLHFQVPTPAAPLVWASSVDGSRADMTVLKEIPTRNTVTRVLLKSVTTKGGPRTTFGNTTFIVRLPVTGGLAPAHCRVPGQRFASPFLTIYLVFKGGTFTTTTATALGSVTSKHY